MWWFYEWVSSPYFLFELELTVGFKKCWLGSIRAFDDDILLRLIVLCDADLDMESYEFWSLFFEIY